jgi:ABC-2 type transport system permease protein
VVRNDLRVLRTDPMVVVVLIAMPLAVMAFIQPAIGLTLKGQGFAHANGAEQAVPGMSVMFAFFIITFGGYGFFREHIWRTWDRLRTTDTRPSAVVAAKVLVPFCLIAAQQALLFVAGGILLDLHVRGSIAAVVVVDLAFIASVVSLVLALVAVSRTWQQVVAAANLGAVLLAGVGGALTPLGTLPGWVKPLAPLTPTYWAMRGFRSAILGGGGVASAAVPALALLGFAVAFLAIAARRFRYDQFKLALA